MRLTPQFRTSLVFLTITAGIVSPHVAGAVRAEDAPMTAEQADSPFAHSAIPLQKRETRQKLVRAAAAIEADKLAEAVELLRDVLSSRELGFVDLAAITPGEIKSEARRFVGVSFAVQQLLARLSPNGLRQFRQQVDPPAEHAIQAAVQNGQASMLRDVMLRFPGTGAGLTALERLAAQHLDHGQWREAEVAWLRVADHPLLPSERIAGVRERAEVARRRSAAGVSRDAIRSPRLFPSVDAPVWQHASTAGRSTVRLVEDAFQVHASQAIARLPRARPEISGNLVIYREPNALSAVSLQTGQVVWSSSATGDNKPAPMAINPALQHLVSRSLAKQFQLDSVQSRFVVHGDLVFTAEWSRSGQRTQLKDSGLGFGQDATSPARNGIVARNKSDGTVAWTLSAGDLPGQPENAFFPGPPTVVGQQVVGQVQVGESVRLYSADRRTGAVGWVLPVAETGGISVADADRTVTACPVIEADGTLICPTAAGLVVGIDLLTRTPAWAIRYPRSDLPPKISRLPAVVAPARRHWWAGWREIEHVTGVDPESGGSIVVLVGTDSDSIHAVDADSGAIRWQRVVSNPLYLAGTTEFGTVISVERHAVAAFSIGSGEEIWRTPLHEPLGRGSLIDLSGPELKADPHLVTPVRGNRFAAVRLSDGAVQLSDVGLIDFAGAMTFGNGRFVTQQTGGVSAWEPAAEAVTRPTVDPLLANGVESPLIKLHVAARNATRAGDFMKALKLYGDVLNGNPSSDVTAVSIGPARRVRHDRLIQGEVLDLISSADAEVRAELRQQFDVWAQQAADSADPFAIQRFVERWRGIPWVNSLAMRDEARIGFSFARSQLELLRLIDANVDGNANVEPDANAAARRLAGMYESRRYTRDAEAIRRMAGLEGDDARNSSPWPDRQPTSSEQTERQADVGYRIIPVKCEPGTLFQRLNVAISDDTNGMRIRFFGDGNSGYWQISLSRGNGAFRGFPMLARGWGIGHLVVLRVGAELFGITPYDASGEPRARILWTRSLIDFQRLGSLQFDASTPGFSINDLTFLDGFDRPIGRVGPVSADALCYQTGGRLICLDTATGRRLWERAELPRNRIVTGDSSSIWLIDRDTGHVQVVRTIDGRQTGEFELWDIAPFAGTILKTHGSIIVLGEHPNDEPSMRYRRVAVLDLSERETLWTANRPANGGDADAYFSVGSNWLGRLSHNGSLSVLDVLTGRVVSEFGIARPSGLRTAFCVSDVESHVIALTSTDELSFQQPRNVYRNPPLTGTLLAIDSRNGTLKWQRRLEGVRLALDQPKNAPLLVLSYEKKRAGENTGFDSILQVLDRRTGEDLRIRRGGASEDRFFIEPNSPQNRVSIRFSRRSIRFDYSAAR